MLFSQVEYIIEQS